jgi:chromosomal replication initiation ATPase DnaA
MLEIILDEVCKYLEVNVSDIKGGRKFRKLAIARFYYCYFARNFYLKSEEQKINEVMELINKNRTTFYNAVKTVQNLSCVDREVTKQLEEIETNIQNRLK